MKEKFFTFGAALYSEKEEKGCFINECESFVTITFKAADVQHMSICNQSISFESNSFEVVEFESHRDWKKIFHCQRTGNKVTISVPEDYVPGFPMPIRK